MYDQPPDNPLSDNAMPPTDSPSPFEVPAGPDCHCQHCGEIVSTYRDITAGQREYRCRQCHRPIVRSVANTGLAAEAFATLKAVGCETTAPKIFM